jgi:serine/threonine protein kinase
MLKIADFGFARSLPDAMLAETLCGSPYVLLTWQFLTYPN